MPKSSNLTPSQAAAVLSISGSTLRRWSKDYTRHLSETARGEAGRHRTYTPADIATLQHAADLLRAGHAPVEVDNLLGLADETQQSAALATLPTLADQQNATRATLAAMRDEWQRYQVEHDATIATLAAEVQSLRDEVAALKGRSWWQRLRGG
jgi:DNA-binding transcriptional MerR regulator